MESRASGLSRSQLLALDVATKTGYYSLHESGTWNFSESLARNGGKQHKAFRDTLIVFIVTHGIRKIVAEDISVNNYFTDIRKLSEFRGILLEVCDELDLPEPEFVNVAALKKFATGNGRATKGEMMVACVNKYRILPLNHDEADAFLLFQYYCRKWRLTR
jgi:Holliday junction resolvasome RuvABC endonuclease subunit